MLRIRPTTIAARGTKRGILLTSCLFALLLIPAARATPGALDPGFGTGGEVTTAIRSGYDAAYALVRQPDGKLVAAGYTHNAVSDDDFALTRYTADGKLDTSFHGTGKVTTTISSVDDEANALVLQSDGKLVAAGYGWNGVQYTFVLARYNPDGSLDKSFNGTGKVTTAIGASDGVNALVLQPDGKIVAAGNSWNGTDEDLALARYNPNGTLDTSFNGTGKVTTAIGPGDDIANALVLQPDGKLVVAGDSGNGSKDDFALARYNPDGKLDTSFNGTGKVTTAFASSFDDAYALARQPDGKLVAAGHSYMGSGKYDFALARYNPDGKLDTSFNGTGKVTTAIGTAYNNVGALVLRPDGKLVAAGTSSSVGSNNDFALAEYDAHGKLEPGFGSGGKVVTSINSGYDAANALALQPDGKIVAAGSSFNGSDSDFALVRYQGNTLTVVKAGSGAGTVTSNPAGISCNSSCSAPFAAVPVTLTAKPAAGSTFAGWTGACTGNGTCTLTMSSDRSVTATFQTACLVPKLKGKTLKAAKHTLHNAHCSPGKLTKAYSTTIKKGHISSQKPHPGKTLPLNAKIKLTLSQGKKP